MLNNLKIQTKLIGLLLFPLLALVVFSSVGYRQRSATAAKAHSDEQIVTAAASAAKLANAVSLESLHTTASQIKGQDASKLKPAQQASDAAFKAFVSANNGVDFGGSSAESTTARNDLATFNDTIFPGFQRTRLSPQDWVSQVTGTATNVITPLSDYVRALASLTTTPEVVLPLEQLAAQMDFVREEGVFATLVYGVSANKSFADGAGTGTGTGTGSSGSKGGATALQQTVAFQIQQRDVALQVRNAVAGTNSSLVSQSNQDASVPSSLDLAKNTWVPETGVASQPADFKIPTTPVTLAEINEYLKALDHVGTEFSNGVSTSIEAHRADAKKAAQLYVVFASLVIILALVLAILIATSVTQRLVKLTAAADRLSHEQLPRLVDSLKNPAEEDVGYLTSSFSEIDVKGNDEIGHLANAYNRIQGVAVQVATEQAQLLRKGIGDMFVNLARRNQGLLDRQIEFIDQLEAAEEDPDQLENLFRLDHLATRMRRNAESLLVLAGAEPNRRRGKPVPLADVVRAAVGEVEDFARIDMLQFDEVLVASNAALDIAHLLSELMENAANFSPPDTRVEVVGHRTKAEGYVISVTDHGIGMTPEAFAESNDLLARPPLVGLALSRSLGFIVIGRLAARFGIAVRLMPSPNAGTTAMVSLPPSLITDQPRTSSDPAAIPGQAKEVPKPAAEPKPASRKPAARKPADSGQGAKAPAAKRKPASTSTAKQTSKPATPSAPAAKEASTAPAAKDASQTATAAPSGGETTSGLKKRVPRSEGGQRAVPGGDGKRSATQNRRSPEEVRSMLSNYRSGMQKGRQDDEPTTPKDAKK